MRSGTEILRGVGIFEGLDDVAAAELARCLRPNTFAKDSVILSQHDRGDSLYIVDSGRVKVVLFGEGGREMILTLLRPGDVFGEMSLLDGQPRSANVVAVENTRVLVLSRSDFVEHMRRHPATALRVLEEMCRRLRRADAIIGNLALLDVFSRVGRALVHLANREGVQEDEGVLIRNRPTHQELASMVGTTRESVSRVLSEYQKRGDILVRGKSILVSYGFAGQAVEE
jgi:CRP-like cAMP-binding protein